MSDEAERLYERLLVVRCQTGDEQAYRELIDRYSPRLRYFLCKRLPHADRTDDLLQEIWLDVFRQLPRLQDAAAFTAWVYQIARGKTLLESRRNGRLPIAMENLDSVAAAQSEPAFSPEDAEQIHAGLDRLNDEHREVLLLRFLEELSYDEIGQVIGCPVGTVRSRLHYAKQALARLLKEKHKD
ncbi:MAG TPA: sigma-70 family RNA polymerase sigma factor [Pirellulales bacterium]|jgi:RNA polymerase sigma-70 factor (ECF subfamily)|nr:sigma-70 family RNA polymerase sigma factor [Pirellulales bacterium]